MKIVVFGLTISSSWGNGHATLLRGLFKALVERGHTIVFFERDVPYYAQHRDLVEMRGVELRFYTDWPNVWREAEAALCDADVAMVTSYCPDGLAATDLVLNSSTSAKVFYDLDTPVTLENLDKGCVVSYIGDRGLTDFDLVLSYTGGRALIGLKEKLGARRVFPLYGSVDPDVHRRSDFAWAFAGDLTYLGTYADDRQAQLNNLFIDAARQMPAKRFIIGGSKYPPNFPWLGNVWYVQHVPPGKHAAFYSSSPLTLNVTRGAMARMGYCPSGRMFEAAACGTAIVSDSWEGLDQFFEPGREVLIVKDTHDVIEALSLSRDAIELIAKAGRDRVLSSHTARHRAREFETILSSAFASAATHVTSLTATAAEA